VPAPAIAATGTLYSSTPAGATAPVAAPTSIAAGHFLLCPMYVEHNGSGTQLSAPSGWLAAPDAVGAFQAIASGCAIYVWYRLADASDVGASSYNMPTQSGRLTRGAIMRITGVDPNDPWDGGDGAVSASASSTPAVSITTTGPDRLAIWSGASYTASAWSTMPSGFTEHATWLSGTNQESTVATQTLASAATVGSAVATGQSNGKAAWVGALKAASAATAPPPSNRRHRLQPFLVR
jgi:hypothetical protein